MSLSWLDRFAQRGEGIAYLLTAGQLGIVGLNDGIDVVKHALVIQTADFSIHAHVQVVEHLHAVDILTDAAQHG